MFKLITLLYRIAFRPLAGLAMMLLLPVSPTLRTLGRLWKNFPVALRKLAALNGVLHAKTRIWIHSPSVGEFESVKWLVEHLLQDPDKSILLTFASPSLEPLLKKDPWSGHERFFGLFFPLDHLGRLLQIRRLFKPTEFVLLQYDFWPNLMEVVLDNPHLKSRSLLNYAPPPESGAWNVLTMAYLQSILNHFTFVHQCSETPERPFLSPDPHITHLSPHTRWGAAGERKAPLSTASQPHDHPPIPRLVAGNTHRSDEPFLHALFTYWAPQHYQLIWVPHEVDAASVLAMQKHLTALSRQYSASFRTYDTLKPLTTDHSPGIILMSAFGLLKHLYHTAVVAYVGGGYNRKGIHNVIEPLSCGCPVIAGPHIQRQPVARWALQQGLLATATRQPESYYPILERHLTQGATSLRVREHILQTVSERQKHGKDILRYFPLA
jgi:3-deoxy-D-manno-octulosonic-acid transferase